MLEVSPLRLCVCLSHQHRRLRHTHSLNGETSNKTCRGIPNEYRVNGKYSREPLARLAALTISNNADVAESATTAFFTGLVEPLADSFERVDVTLYNRLFAQVIQVCRADPRARALDSELSAFGLNSEEELIARAEKLRGTTPLYGWRDRAKKLRRLIVLSRVTLGDEHAVTSVIINRLKHCLAVPQTVIGGAKLKELFGGDADLSFKESAARARDDYRKAARLDRSPRECSRGNRGFENRRVNGIRS